MEYEIVKPIMFFADVWPRDSMDQTRMQAYKQLESENQIRVTKVTYNKPTELLVIEYKSTIPHEWVIDELKKRVSPARKDEQMKLEM